MPNRRTTTPIIPGCPSSPATGETTAPIIPSCPSFLATVEDYNYHHSLLATLCRGIQLPSSLAVLVLYPLRGDYNSHHSCLSSLVRGERTSIPIIPWCPSSPTGVPVVCFPSTMESYISHNTSLL
ncbi:hypothetical protein SRHO_G00210680 [Serrasalmus rhombeus]